MTATPGQPVPSAVERLRQRAGVKDYACGLCGEEFGSNLGPGDIQCTNDDCEARRCPACEAWFTEDGESSLDLRDIPALREQLRLAREDRDQLRTAVLDLAAGLEESAAKTAPSKKSQIENAAAARLRTIAEPPA